MVKPGNPGATSTSTRMSRPSRPWSVAERSEASTAPRYVEPIICGLSGACEAHVIRRSGLCICRLGDRQSRAQIGTRLAPGTSRRPFHVVLVQGLNEIHDVLAQSRVRFRVHERRAAIQGADR